MSTVAFGTTEARAAAQWAVTPLRVDLRRVFLSCGLVLAAQLPLALWLEHSWREALLAGGAFLVVVFGAVFVLAAVTVAGFAAGAAAAGLVTLGIELLPVLAGAAGLAVLCGLAPGWARLETWQAARSAGLTSGDQAAVVRAPLPVAGRHRPAGPGRRLSWRGDRVVAAFLVLAFPPAITELSIWFVGWTAQR